MTEKGYKEEPKIAPSGASFGEGEKQHKLEELSIVSTYRFEGDSDPANLSIQLATESNDGQKTYLLSAYGTYSAYDKQHYDG